MMEWKSLLTLLGTGLLVSERIWVKISGVSKARIKGRFRRNASNVSILNICEELAEKPQYTPREILSAYDEFVEQCSYDSGTISPDGLRKTLALHSKRAEVWKKAIEAEARPPFFRRLALFFRRH